MLNKTFHRLFFNKTNQKLKKQADEVNKYRLVLDQAPAAVYIINKDMYFEYINPAFTKQSGYTREDLLNKHVYETIYKGEIPESRKPIAEALLRGDSWQGELLTYHKTGRTYWASTTAAPYKNDQGKVEGFVIIQQDITEHKKMEIALNESENLYRSLIENSMDGMVISQDFKFLFTNRIFEEMIGYSRDELMKMEALSIIHPHDREKLLQKHQERMNGNAGSQRYNASLVRKDGRVFEAEINAAKITIKGTPASFVTLRDITERERLNMALRESETKYKALVENSQDGISIIRDNRYLYANKKLCEMLGYSLNELLEMPSHLTIHPDDREKAEQLGHRRRKLDFSTIREHFRMLSKTGEIRECETISTMIEYGGVYASFFTAHDVTESKRMQLKLKESEEKYRQLVETTNSIILKWDKDFRITFLNEFGLKFFGFTQAEILLNPMVGTIIPHSEAMSGRNLTKLMEDIFNHPEQYAYNENENIRKNGERVWIAWNNTPVRNEYGETVSMYSIGTDITQSKLMQMQLKENEEKYRQLFTAESDAIFMINADTGQILDVNPAAVKIYGFTHSEMLSMKNTDISAEPDKTVEATQSNQTLVPLRYHKKKDGTIFPVELSAGFTTINHTKIQIVTSRDITERIKAEQQLRKVSESLEVLNQELEQRVQESSNKLTEARTQLLNLQKENIQSQFDVLRQQVNPHFLFNSLNVLTSLIKLEPDLAEQFSEHLSKVYRYVLENKDNELVNLKTELNFLEAYIFLLNIRFVGKLKVNTNISESCFHYQIIPLAMQLLIENAIKHNVMSKAMPLTIDIFIDEENYLNIINNLNERPTQLVSTGVGLKNIQSRYLLLNKTEPVFIKTKKQFIAKVPLITHDIK